jgi:hypothetical protein
LYRYNAVYSSELQGFVVVVICIDVLLLVVGYVVGLCRLNQVDP